MAKLLMSIHYKNINNISNILLKLDKWSDKTIKESLLGSLKPLIKAIPQFKSLNTLLIISLGILFISLILPQFANDRFGIGIIIIICSAVFLVNLKSYRINFNTIDFLIIAFLLIATISTFSSYFLKESLIGLFKYFIFFLSYFVFKFTLLNSSHKQFISLWYVLFICGVIASFIGIYQYIIGVEPLATWEDANSENIHSRVYSTLGNPNLLAGFLLPILPLSIVLPFKANCSLFLKSLSLLCSGAILVCIMFTGSRGGYIGLISGFVIGLIAYLIFLVSSNKKIKKRHLIGFIFIGLIFLLFAIYFLFPIFTERLSTIFTIREHSSNSYRVNVWLACLKMLKANWILGIGPGNNTFRLSYGLYMISGFDALGAYNIFLELTIETGILGCLSFLCIFLISFLKLHCIFWKKGELIALGIFISLVAMLTHGIVDTVFFRPQIFIPYWFLTASIAKLDDINA